MRQRLLLLSVLLMLAVAASAEAPSVSLSGRVLDAVGRAVEAA